MNKDKKFAFDSISGSQMAVYLRKIADAVADSEKSFTAKLVFKVFPSGRGEGKKED